MTSTNNKVGKYFFTLEPGLVNALNELPLPRLVEWLISVAGSHAGERGWGYTRLKSDEQAWVLIRLSIESVSFPASLESLTIETCVDGINKHFSARNFRVTDSNGNVCFYAKSLWTIIDLNTRKSVDLLSVANEIEQEIDNIHCPIQPPIKVANVQTQEHVPIQIQFSDLDINRHVNSGRYVEYVINALGLKWHLRHKIDRMDVNFQSEILFDESIALKIQHFPDRVLFELCEAETEKSKCKISITYSIR